MFTALSFATKGQNIFDKSHSVAYANFLFNSGDYELASQEYLRISFVNNNPFYKLRLLKSYRLSGKPDVEYSLFYNFFPKYNFPNDTFAFEYLIMHRTLNLTPNYNQIMSNYHFKYEVNKNLFTLAYLLYHDQFTKALQTANNIENTNGNKTLGKLIKISTESAQLKFKKPLIAGVLSSIIPGSGKIYSGYFWDGILSFLFVAGNTYVAYKGFNKYGISSGLGWTFSGISTFFYLGNIYGSVKAAKRKNKKLKNAIYNKVDNIINNNF